MAKRMQDKESIAGVSWLIVLALSCWGGLVRYLIDVKQKQRLMLMQKFTT